MLPKHLKRAIEDKATSLGDHPAFPPDDERSFLEPFIELAYENAMAVIDKEDRDDIRAISAELDRIVTEIKKEESSSKEALEQLCGDTIAEIFQIPEDTITLDFNIVDKCDMSRYRMTPESTDSFQFEDIDEMEYLTDEIYKRRMVDAIISGISVA